MTDKPTRDPARVVRIPESDNAGVVSKVRRPGLVHGLAIAGMALFSLVGIGAAIAFVTVGWPGNTGRYVTAVIFVSVVGFLLSATTAVFAAARDTYAHPTKRRSPGD
ncbi:MAG: hypothetical protein ACRDJV_05315 [Actinomycetota bacterium]